MAARYVALGVIGSAIGLYGAFTKALLVLALGLVTIVAAFFWFALTNQGTGTARKGDESVRT